MPILKGYAIISREGMIANVDGSFPESLKLPGDQRFFRAGLRAADIIIHGRNSGEARPETARRSRIVLTRQVAGVARDPLNDRAVLWNPDGAGFSEALGLLGPQRPEAVAAILGGTDVFGLFLGIGYDAFYLSCADVGLPTGRTVFPDAGPPQAQLEAAGLVCRQCQELDAMPRVMLQRWYRRV
jgi:dihydrofolate reductase